MGRLKKYNRETILKKAMLLFWKQGFASTSLQDLEKATGVNKSGLYSEFKDKEDLFLEALRYYLQTRSAQNFLIQEPLGWANIQNFFKHAIEPDTGEHKGCFSVNSLRELRQLPPAAQKIIKESRVYVKKLLAKNIAAEKTKMTPAEIAEILATFLFGLCIEQNFKTDKTSASKKIKALLKSFQSL